MLNEWHVAQSIRMVGRLLLKCYAFICLNKFWNKVVVLCIYAFLRTDEYSWHGNEFSVLKVTWRSQNGCNKDNMTNHVGWKLLPCWIEVTMSFVVFQSTAKCWHYTLDFTMWWAYIVRCNQSEPTADSRLSVTRNTDVKSWNPSDSADCCLLAALSAPRVIHG